MPGLNINITATDNASKTMEKVSRSTKDLIVGFSGLATSAFSLYNAYDRVADMQLNVDRANLKVNSSMNSLEDAQRRYNDAIEKYGINSEEAATAQADLTLAQERYNVATDAAKQTQDNMNEAMVQSALQVVPTAITMVDSFSKVWKNFPDMTGMLKNLSSNITTVGSNAKIAALGVAGFMGGFLIGYTIIQSLPEDLRAIATALTVSIAAIIAATVAWMAFHGTVTMGVAVPVILAAVGAGIGAIVAMMTAPKGMAKGGTTPYSGAFLVGEQGPELVNLPMGSHITPNNQLSGLITVHNSIYIGNISSAFDLEQVTEAASKGVAEALDRRE